MGQPTAEPTETAKGTMRHRDIHCTDFQGLELRRQLLSRKNSAIRAFDADNSKSKETLPNVLPSASASRYNQGFLLKPWITEQERLRRDSERTATNTKRQHALFAEHLLVSMLCSEDLPEKSKDAGTETEAPTAVDEVPVNETLVNAADDQTAPKEMAEPETEKPDAID